MSEPFDNRAGFSVIEALVVLVIAGTALLLVFQMGVRGSETGFRLGRRALTTADAEPGSDSFRAIVRGLVLTTPLGSVAPGLFSSARSSLVGDERGFVAEASLDRATVCAPAGPTGPIAVRLVASARGDILVCEAGGGAPQRLIDLRPARGRFSYSDDGAIWRDAPSLRADGGRLQVRLTTDDGELDIVEQAAPTSIVEAVVDTALPAGEGAL